MDAAFATEKAVAGRDDDRRAVGQDDAVQRVGAELEVAVVGDRPAVVQYPRQECGVVFGDVYGSRSSGASSGNGAGVPSMPGTWARCRPATSNTSRWTT